MKHLKVKLACYSAAGKVRTHNEDNVSFFGTCLPEEHVDMEDVLVKTMPGDGSFTVAVFDGMGGEQAGEVASRAAAEELKKHEALRDIDEQKLTELISGINAAVCAEKYKGGYRQIGTTVAMLAFDGGTVWAVNVGDSPVFLLRGGRMREISTSHTRDMGKRRVLTQCLGIDEEEFLVEPYIEQTRLEAGDKWLICSDGLTDMVSEEAIAEILSSTENAATKADLLIRKAMEGGGRDNITVILAEVYEDTPDEKPKETKKRKSWLGRLFGGL